MKRKVSLEEISDGRLYGRNDMVRANCQGCKGCSTCCHGMGESVILDPYDAWQLSNGLKQPFASLIGDKIELQVVDGVILPNLRMKEGTDACGFLDAQGRCSIHSFRPGVCRLFPLGRYYAEELGEGNFRYFLQVHECPMPNKTKVKISRWLEIPELEKYEAYIGRWHKFLNFAERRLQELDEEQARNGNLLIVKLFFLKEYAPEDFYAQFEARMQIAEEAFS